MSTFANQYIFKKSDSPEFKRSVKSMIDLLVLVDPCPDLKKMDVNSYYDGLMNFIPNCLLIGLGLTLPIKPQPGQADIETWWWQYNIALNAIDVDILINKKRFVDLVRIMPDFLHHAAYRLNRPKGSMKNRFNKIVWCFLKEASLHVNDFDVPISQIINKIPSPHNTTPGFLMALEKQDIFI